MTTPPPSQSPDAASETPETPETRWLPVAAFVATYPPAYYAARWEDIDHEGEEIYDDPDDPDGEFDQRFLAGGDTGIEFDDLVMSVAGEGIRNPVDIENGEVADGHHRVVAAMLTGREVPYRVWSHGVPMGFGDADDLTQGFFNSDDGALYDTCCHDPALAAGMAFEVCEPFADYLHREGHTDAVVLTLISTVDHPYVPTGTSHAVVQVAGAVLDLTHRQFDPSVDVPHIRPAGEFLVGWRVAEHP